MEDRSLRWQVQPLAVRPLRGVMALVAIAALSTAAGLFGGDLLWGLMAALMLGVALNRAFLPSRYQLNDGGIVVDHPLRRREFQWASIERLAFDEHGALLTASAARLSIDFPAQQDRAAAIAAALRDHAVEGCAVVDRRVAHGPST